MHYQREGVYEDLDGSDLARQARQHRLPHPLKPMELHQPFPPHPPATPDTKGDRLSAWDVVYALNMGMACLITYWIITCLLSGFVDQAANFLGGMGRRRRRLCLQGHSRACTLCGNGAADSDVRQLRIVLAVPLAFPVYASRPRNPARHRHARDGAIAAARRHRDNGNNNHGCSWWLRQ